MNALENACLLDLYELITEVMEHHRQGNEWGYPTEDCCCGDDHDGTDTWTAHIGRVVGDMLIDLAGTGQLLASIDRIARQTQS